MNNDNNYETPSTTKSVFVYDWTTENVNGQLNISFFGLDTDNKSFYSTITDFQPYFYLEIPDTINWSKKNIDLLVRTLESKFWRIVKPVSYSLKYRRKLYYVHMNPDNTPKYFPYILFHFKDSYEFKSFRYKLNTTIKLPGLGDVKICPREINVSPVLQLVSELNIPMCGWVTIRDLDNNNTKEISYNQLSPCEEQYITPKPIVMSFDIESYSSRPNCFPDPRQKNDAVFQISCVFWRFSDQQQPDKYLLTLGDVKDNNSDYTTYSYTSEVLLLYGFMKLIKKYQPHVITGWNILEFDFAFILDRCELLYITDRITKLGMNPETECQEVKDEWASSAVGKNNIRYIHWDGRVVVDLLSVSRRDEKFENNKLETVASEVLGVGKDPITHKDIFKSYETGVLKPTPEGLKLLSEVGKYCVKDSELVQRLFETWQTWTTITEMATVCNVPCVYMYTKGQQIKVFSQIYKYCTQNKIVAETGVYKTREYDLYTGAYVKEPIPGVYDNVIPFDFQSMYVTLIISYNIDYTTYVEEIPENQSITDDMCHVIEWEEDGIKHRHRFLKEPPGVIPTIIKNLLNARKDTRNYMEKVNRKELLNILNKRQLSYKVSANSMYGILGSHGSLSFMLGAMAITAMGRASVKKAGHYLVDKYNVNWIYSDTDSTYIQLQDTPPDQLYQRAKQIEQEIIDDNIFPAPMKLEFEKKVYDPFFILTKKRYMWNTLLEDGSFKDKIESKGVALVRRGMGKFLKDIYKTVVDAIFNKKSEQEIMDIIVNYFNDCCSHSMDISKFVLTKVINPIESFKKKELSEIPEKRTKRLKDLDINEDDSDFEELYLIRSLPAHIQLAHKIKSRGKNVHDGERLEYIVTTRGNLKSKLSVKIEDVEYQRQFSHILHIDFLHYIHLCVNQLDEVLDLILSKPGFVESQYKLRFNKVKLHGQLLGHFRPRIEFRD